MKLSKYPSFENMNTPGRRKFSLFAKIINDKILFTVDEQLKFLLRYVMVGMDPYSFPQILS